MENEKKLEGEEKIIKCHYMGCKEEAITTTECIVAPDATKEVPVCERHVGKLSEYITSTGKK